MKRVAQGDAAKHELEKFQAIIDAITAESKRKGTPVGPAADRLLVDGRTVRFFADEVSAILDIVLRSNPRQTSASLRPPPNSDLLVVMLVKTALDDAKTRDIVRRIAANKPLYTDATELKATLDKLKTKLVKDAAQSQAANSARHNGVANGHTPAGSSSTPASPAVAHATTPTAPVQQALRSKGPAPVKPDISAVVIEWTGGNGDRYLFPKFSVLESVRVTSGQHVVASFLIVLKGSGPEHPAGSGTGDVGVTEYYEPLTIRMHTPVGRHLENLFRVVAPEEEVRRYMDDVMERATRAEYIYLAYRLPRQMNTSGNNGGELENGGTPEASGTATQAEGKDKDKETKGSAKSGSGESKVLAGPPQVLWTTSTGSGRLPKPEIRELPPRARLFAAKVAGEAAEESEYQNFISRVGQKRVEEV
jgi:hypothetical protein